ncbi:PRADC1-like protein [Oratosquilla oratoria]|uniref:PRADC1-like protein n=1 Tax=Oratosquilla oratoria TaxID=337810 RepID=UPI003F759FDF
MFYLFVILFYINTWISCHHSLDESSFTVWDDVAVYDFIEDDIFFEVIYPEKIKYSYRLRQARDFGMQFKMYHRNIKLVLVDPPECCSELFNAAELRGAVALAKRGDCSFVSKTIKAEEAGAVAIIVTHSDASNDEVYIEMIDDNTGRNPQIPAAFLLGRSGYMIEKTLSSLRENAAIINIPVNLTNVPFNKRNQPPWVLI